MVFVNVSSVNLALLSTQHGFGMSDVGPDYIVTAYATVLGGFLLLGARLSGTFGRRRLRDRIDSTIQDANEPMYYLSEENLRCMRCRIYEYRSGVVRRSCAKRS